ncbi:hypothetical protein [Streptomyces silvisoli]|uniref:Uncharacterized protein n=1 Tax=Streptomyces silvisoli TaxID=3034235 RepID=A0ABT5ZI93_9ACTN|nr:hypothetical protein [Streptomyces silvisoli]MDF3289550.1 hypothetical protein [Streptomyces silvisoli]
MGRPFHFHIDHAGHSITVTVRSGLTSEIELLVDGKEVFRQRVHGSGTSLLSGELPEDPPLPFRIHVHQARFGSAIPRVTLEVDGEEVPIPERAIA